MHTNMHPPTLVKRPVGLDHGHIVVARIKRHAKVVLDQS